MLQWVLDNCQYRIFGLKGLENSSRGSCANKPIKMNFTKWNKASMKRYIQLAAIVNNVVKYFHNIKDQIKSW